MKEKIMTSLAQETSNPTFNIQIPNPFAADNIYELIEKIVNDILMPVGGVIAALMVMYAGFLFVTARGNEAQITKAKQALLWAVIGAAILLGRVGYIASHRRYNK